MSGMKMKASDVMIIWGRLLIIWGRLLIIWVGARFKPLLARRAIVLKIEMLTWVCGTVGLLRAFE